MFHDPQPPGYVCPRTKRVAVLVADLAESDLNGAVTAYLFLSEADAMDSDPWRLVDGVNAHECAACIPGGHLFDVVFANGSTVTVGPLMTVFLAADDAERLRRDVIGG